MTDMFKSPAVLVALAYASNTVGDKQAVRIIRQKLEAEFGIRLSFVKRNDLTQKHQQST